MTVGVGQAGHVLKVGDNAGWPDLVEQRLVDVAGNGSKLLALFGWNAKSAGLAEKLFSFMIEIDDGYRETQGLSCLFTNNL